MAFTNVTKNTSTFSNQTKNSSSFTNETKIDVFSALDTSLLYHWSFNEGSGNAIDSVSGKSLANVNTVTYASAKINNGAVFSGSNSFSTTAIAFTDPNILGIAVWLYPTNLSSRKTIFSTRGNADAGSFQLEYGVASGGAIQNVVAVTTPGVYNFITVNDVLTLNTWNHIVFTRNGIGDTCKVYVNGVLKSFQSVSPVTFINNSSNPGIGGAAVGTFDEMDIYDRYLTEADAILLYNRGYGLTLPRSLFINETKS